MSAPVEREPDGGGLSAGVALFAIVSYLVGRSFVSADASVLHTLFVGMACLIIPAVLLLAFLLSAGAHHPPRRRHHRRRYYR